MPEEPRAIVPTQQPDAPVVPDIESLLPTPSANGVTEQENARLSQFQTALIVIGQAAGGALVCPGNQLGVADSQKCPYAAKCELLRVQKAPANELCPIERELILARFHGWCNTLTEVMGVTIDPKTLREDVRAVISELVWIDIQEQRCNGILARGEAARLTQINVKDSNPETGEWISWERVIHSNSVLLESLHTRRRMIFKEWMLNPQEKFKAARAMGKLGSGEDLSKKLSARHDRLKDLEPDYIEAEFTEVPDQK